MKGVIFTDGRRYIRPTKEEFRSFLIMHGWVTSLVFPSQFNDEEILEHTPNTAYPVRYLIGSEQLSMGDPNSTGEVIDVRSKTMIRKALRNGGVSINSVCEYPVTENDQTAFFNQLTVILLPSDKLSNSRPANFNTVKSRSVKFYEFIDNQLREF